MVKTDGFELPDVIAAARVVSVLVGRIGSVAGSARTVIGLEAPLTVIAGQAVYGVMRRAIAWLFAPISTQAWETAASEGQVTCRLKVALHPASPSETVRVSDAVPGAVQVSVGFCAVALLSVPEVVVQL